MRNQMSLAYATLVIFFCPNLLSCTFTNIILLLADDLGYGDTSVSPFSGTGIYTPELQKLAERGVVATNFHTAAPICTPSRGSFLTGLFPWRLGISTIFGTGRHSMDTLLRTPNSPMTFKENGYHTAHIGKWHLGGTTSLDLQDRNLGGQCLRPGVHQHGFEESVIMTEGPGSERLNFLIPQSTLYSVGARYLLHNEKIPKEDRTDEQSLAVSPVAELTYQQASEAIRILNDTVSRGVPLYLHVWFDNPHGPWEIIEPFQRQYGSRFGDNSSSMLKYASMVSALDFNIGRIVRAIDALGQASNTLILFASDNGPERDAGTAGRFKGGKRSLLEGGIRVPAIWVWEGVIPANRTTDQFMVATDVFPTFAHAAAIPLPKHVRLDGRSVLPELLRPTTHSPPINSKHKYEYGDDRPVLWRAAIRWNGYKLIENAKGQVPKFFDLRTDLYEDFDLSNQLNFFTGNASVVIPPQDIFNWTFLTEYNRKDNSVMQYAKDIMLATLVAFRTKGDKPLRKAASKNKYSSCMVPVASDIVSTFFGDGIEVPQFGDNVRMRKKLQQLQ